MKKEVVQNIVNVVERHLQALEFTVVSGEDEKLKILDETIDQLRKLIDEYKPTEHEMFSNHTRRLYIEMQKARGIFEGCKKLGVDSEDIREARRNYEQAVEKYEGSKKIRNMLKD